MKGGSVPTITSGLPVVNPALTPFTLSTIYCSIKASLASIQPEGPYEELRA
jgi:hypothetical protein